MRIFPLAALALFVAAPLAAQKSDELNFLSNLDEFDHIREMLPSYLKRHALEFLDKREQQFGHLSTLDDLARRKAYVRDVMLRDLGGLPERTPLNARVTGEIDRGDYKIQKIIFESQPRFYVTANLYLPKTGQPPYPAVLYPLGHELGAKSHSAWQIMLGSLAKKGYVALAWDPTQFTFVDPHYTTTSEENPQDIQVGEQFVARLVNAVTHAPTWKNTALFLTYDEHGGYYDHVGPPPAIKPDSIPPKIAPGDAPSGYDRYGFRVPMIVISPWARRRYVSRVVQDHASMTAFIERKWNLPAMTFRDANADPMTDYFDFSRPSFAKPPPLAAPPPLGPGIAACHAQGITPPLPTSATEGARPARGARLGGGTSAWRDLQRATGTS